MTDLSIANTIYQQIGKQAMFMIGAQHIAGDANSLRFKIRGSKQVSHIKIELLPTDVYEMTFYKVTRMTKPPKVVAVETGVYDDMLKTMIQKHTGLFTALGTMGKVANA